MTQFHDDDLPRRDFHKLSLSAFSGLLLGTLGCSDKKGDKPAAQQDAANPGADEAGAVVLDEKLLLDEPHVCRGLNACKGIGKGGDNACAGQGTCATAVEHTCHYENDCKGQGGCGGSAGQNACKEKGECGVPLGDGTWKKVRAKFEELMAKEGKKVGPAPAA